MQTKQDHTAARRKAHYTALETLANLPAGEGVKLWRKLRKIETLAHSAHEHYCNEPMPFVTGGRSYAFSSDENALEAFHDREIIPAIARAFNGKIPAGFFINSDPRGYSLKLRGGFIPAGLEKDWGSYGILAHEIN